MNPYAPSNSNSTESEAAEDDSITIKTSRRMWPLILLNLAFLLCAILVVVLPGLGSWLLVSVLVVFSVGGWTLALSMRQE